MSSIKAFIVEDSQVILINLVATLEEMSTVHVVGSAPDEASAARHLASDAEVEFDLKHPLTPKVIVECVGDEAAEYGVAACATCIPYEGMTVKI